VKKYKFKGFRELMSEEDANEMYICNYCSDVLIEDGVVRKDWYLHETCYGHYCCEKDECVWEYFGEHSGLMGEDEIEDTVEVCENCEENKQMKDSDFCSECEKEIEGEIIC